MTIPDRALIMDIANERDMNWKLEDSAPCRWRDGGRAGLMDAPAGIHPHQLQARLLGSVQILVNGAIVQDRAWTRRTARSLLLLLLITPSHRLPRDQVLDALWPTLSPEAADRSLRKAVHALRRVLEPDLRDGRTSAFLEVGGETIALVGDLDLWVDVDAFVAEIAAARSASPREQRQHLQQALSMYGGEHMADQPYADWGETQREHLRLQRRGALLTLTELDLGMDTPEASAPLFDQLLSVEPTDEVALRTLGRRDGLQEPERPHLSRKARACFTGTVVGTEYGCDR